MEKWFFIAIGSAFVALFLGMGYSTAAKETARADIVKACYQAGKDDCQKVWKDD